MTASIHSHPFNILNGDGYYKIDPSSDDKEAFGTIELNIIVGYIYSPKSIYTAYPNSEDNLGAAFFNSSSERVATMSINSIQRIINHKSKAAKRHK